MKAFIKGLDACKIGNLVVVYPDLMKDVFVYKLEQLTAAKFMSLVSSKKPPTSDEAQAFENFCAFVYHLEGMGRESE